MTNKVEIDKKYRTRDGLAVRVLCTDRNTKDYSVVMLVIESDGSERLLTATADGRYIVDTEEGESSPYDLVEISPWDDFKVDEPVMVREHDSDKWARRYFADVIGGQPRTWADGSTAWSSYAGRTPVLWLQCRRPTEEELQTKATP